MDKLQIKNFLHLSKRSYAVATENMGTQPEVSAIRKAAKDVKEDQDLAEKKENYWMRDPKTGNWIPESHFNEIDVAELREKLLSKKERVSSNLTTHST